MRITVVITPQGRPDHLERCLGALAHQTDRDFVVRVALRHESPKAAWTSTVWEILGDVRSVTDLHVMSHTASSEFPNAAAARNACALFNPGEVLIFNNADTLVPPDFIAAHRERVRPGVVSVARCGLLSRAESEALLNAPRPRAFATPEIDWTDPDLIERSLSLAHDPVRRRPVVAHEDVVGPMSRGTLLWTAAQGSVIALLTGAFLRVRGFDGRFLMRSAASYTDLVARLMNAGLRARRGYGSECGLQLAPDSPEEVSTTTAEDVAVIERRLKDRAVLPASEAGLDQHF